MSTIARTGFRATFADGIDLQNPNVAEGLAHAGVAFDAVAQADLNGDGVIAGRRELNRAFDVIDGFDRNGSRHSFLDDADGGAIYRALLTGRIERPPAGAAIAQAALARIATDGAGYAVANAPTSPFAALSGNELPGVSRPRWLEGQNKCNQFVGDVLVQAGMMPPTVTMANGTQHYARAEQWPTRHDLFDRVTNPDDIQVGDIVVRDYPTRGASGAHVEVVTSVQPFQTAGAHAYGASVNEGSWLTGARYDASNRSFSVGGSDVYVLRPKARLAE